tara:strand:- start:3863 stop:4192 length:330 start_codon:yes stop_codon:yes gene_type:complete
MIRSKKAIESPTPWFETREFVNSFVKRRFDLTAALCVLYEDVIKAVSLRNFGKYSTVEPDCYDTPVVFVDFFVYVFVQRRSRAQKHRTLAGVLAFKGLHVQYVHLRLRW